MSIEGDVVLIVMRDKRINANYQSTSAAEFRGMPLPLLRLALATLEKTGRAKVFEGSESGDSMTGVKFA